MKLIQCKATTILRIFEAVNALYFSGSQFIQLFDRFLCCLLYVLSHIGFMQNYCANTAWLSCCMFTANTIAVDLQSHILYLTTTATNDPMTTRRLWELRVTINHLTTRIHNDPTLFWHSHLKSFSLVNAENDWNTHSLSYLTGCALSRFTICKQRHDLEHFVNHILN